MAKQDYSRVAPDVLKAKAKFFPVMQHMFQLQKEHKEFSTLWMIARSIAAGGQTLRENVDVSGVGLAVIAASATGGTAGAMEAASGSLTAVNVAMNTIFDHYVEEQELKRSLEKQLQEVKEEYINYLSEFAPVYYKYMKEWDRLCLNKDKAYLDIYSGRAEDALKSTEAVLQQSPNNREGLLLKSLCLIDLGKMSKDKNIQFYIVPTDDDHQSETVGDYYQARAYLSGFTGSAGTLLVMQDEAYLWTDGRYFIQAAKELYEGITLMKMGQKGVPTLLEFLIQHIQEHDKIAFDGQTMACQFILDLKKQLKIDE